MCVFFQQEYLAAAFNYLEDQPTRTPVGRIKGIWVASDDENVVNEVRSLAHAYFPNVRNEDIVYVAGGVPGGIQIPNVTTVSMRQVKHLVSSLGRRKRSISVVRIYQPLCTFHQVILVRFQCMFNTRRCCLLWFCNNTRDITVCSCSVYGWSSTRILIES